MSKTETAIVKHLQDGDIDKLIAKLEEFELEVCTKKISCLGFNQSHSARSFFLNLLLSATSCPRNRFFEDRL